VIRKEKNRKDPAKPSTAQRFGHYHYKDTRMPRDDSQARTVSLADHAYDYLHEFFIRADHRPSREQWSAIRDLLGHLERAADNTLDEAVYVSPIPAGTGKSCSIAAFAFALMDSGAYADTGMLITVNRIAEAKDMAEALRGYRDRLCVHTSDPAVNELGHHTHAAAAQVCVSTQAALKLTLKALAGAPFGAASRFHYRGARRAILCWDESFALQPTGHPRCRYRFGPLQRNAPTVRHCGEHLDALGGGACRGE
jgi:hypothetical protein